MRAQSLLSKIFDYHPQKLMFLYFLQNFAKWYWNDEVLSPKRRTVFLYTPRMHLHTHRCTIFMQACYPCHRSKVETNFVAKSKIKVLEGLSNSPNLNLIYDLWMEMKDKLAEKQPSKAKNLIRVIKEV